MTTAAKMAFHLKDLGWRGSGDAVVIVVLVLWLLQVARYSFINHKRESTTTAPHFGCAGKEEILHLLIITFPGKYRIMPPSKPAFTTD